MSKVKFTEEQQKELRNNKYTARVTANSLSFTKEFKELFYQVRWEVFHVIYFVNTVIQQNGLANVVSGVLLIA